MGECKKVLPLNGESVSDFPNGSAMERGMTCFGALQCLEGAPRSGSGLGSAVPPRQEMWLQSRVKVRIS